MNPENLGQEELRQREEALRIKEKEIRLRELEMELNRAEQDQQQSMQPEPPLYETTKHEEPGRKRSWLRKLPKMIKFGLMVFSSFVLIWAATAIAYQIARIVLAAVIVGGICFMGYKLYVEGDD
ncbi:MAG: hypothetical protein F6K30_22285 [Cyanothece sp. SIO2G6]|nr:hypothetical protein [Cyanothece sp. SIO2G6]